MNQLEFGAFLADLRAELRLTQAQLAERLGQALDTIRRIEQGRQSDIYSDALLLKLASALHLNTLERREFIMVASGAFLHPSHSEESFTQIQTAFEALQQDLGHLALPAFVTDSYCDILLANAAAFKFYPIPPEIFALPGSSIGSFNQTAYVFHRSSTYFSNYGATWQRQALIHCRYFHRRTLRVRTTRYFKLMFQDLMDSQNYPLFPYYWEKALYEPMDEFSHVIHSPLEDSDFAFKEVDNLILTTPIGDLFLHQALPINQKTAAHMLDIVKSIPPVCVTLAPFPDPRKI